MRLCNECAFGREDLELGREEIGKLVELWDDQEAMHAAIGDTDGDGDVDADDRVALRFAVETTQRFAFPSYRESEFTDREPIDTMETIPLFEELDTFPLKVPQEASMMGYRVWETPVLPFHFPASVVPDVRVGAQEESIIRKGCRLPEDMQQASAAIDAASRTKAPWMCVVVPLARMYVREAPKLHTTAVFCDHTFAVF